MTWLHIGPSARVMLALAGAAWAGAASGRWWGTGALLVPAGVVVFGAVLPRHRSRVALAALLAAVGWWSGHMSALREDRILDHATPSGPVAARFRLLGDPREGDFGWWALAVPDPPELGRPPSIPLLVSFDGPPPGRAGERLRVEGHRLGRSGRARGDPYSGVVEVREVHSVEESDHWWWRAGNLVRSRAVERLGGHGPDRALLAGFLVGDTSGVPEADMEAMRRTGLTHLVAVSGSNVSLFLTLTLVAAGPLAAGPRRRAVLGIVALVVLVVATRWESSVVRASVMAALMLGGRIGGWALDAATALAVTVIAVVAVSGEIATDVGFTLSVLATLGVLAGANLRSRLVPGPLGRTLAATVGAQVAVAPVLLATFGRIPLFSPLANLVAVPVVGVATVVGAIGVAVGWEWMIDLAAVGARVVLGVARLGAAWPQIAWGGLAVALAGGGMLAFRRIRPLVAMAMAAAAAVALVAGTGRLPQPGAAVLDVGQGDAILVVSGDGRTMLVDGGPDPAHLEEKLSHYGVVALDLVVVTHVHADHVTGLEAVVGRRPVGEIWLPTPPHETPASRRFGELVAESGVPSRLPPVGDVVRLGDLEVEVLGPMRRYASPNDQSTVLRVSVPGGPRLLLTGDVETHAQADLDRVPADILKVPHQGAATSDPAWIAGVGADLALVSVGENDFGHPSPAILEALRANDARVARTDVEGDLAVSLGRR